MAITSLTTEWNKLHVKYWHLKVDWKTYGYSLKTWPLLYRSKISKHAIHLVRINLISLKFMYKVTSIIWCGKFDHHASTNQFEKNRREKVSKFQTISASKGWKSKKILKLKNLKITKAGMARRARKARKNRKARKAWKAWKARKARKAWKAKKNIPKE